MISHQSLRGERLVLVFFVCHVVQITTRIISSKQRNTVFLPVQLRYHIAVHGTGFQNKELSTQDADHVALKKLSQRLHNRVVKEGVLNRLFQSTAPMHCEQFLADPKEFRVTSQEREISSLLRHLIPEAQTHSKRPSSFVTPSSSIKSSNERYNSLQDSGQLSERPVCNLERTF